jgi:hypothetical protein
MSSAKDDTKPVSAKVNHAFNSNSFVLKWSFSQPCTTASVTSAISTNPLSDVFLAK